MSIIRTIHNRENPYVQLNKSGINDVNLSFKALGLWTWAMSKPTDWKFYISQIYNERKEGKTSIYNIIKELIDNGYCVRMQIKEKDESGRLIFKGVEYLFYEFKVSEEDIEELKKRFPHSGFLDTESSDPENVPLLKKENTTKERLEIKSSSSCLVPPEIPKKIDDDDLKQNSFFEDSKQVEVTKTNGAKISMTQSEIYRYFSRKPEYTTDMIKEAIQKIRIVTGPINDIIKYLEATCLSILKGSQNRPSYAKKELRPNETWGPIEKKPLISMGELMKQQELEEKNKRLGDKK